MRVVRIRVVSSQILVAVGVVARGAKSAGAFLKVLALGSLELPSASAGSSRARSEVPPVAYSLVSWLVASRSSSAVLVVSATASLVASAVTPSIAASLVSAAVGLSERGGLGRSRGHAGRLLGLHLRGKGLHHSKRGGK